jgi:hypothetical protein
MPTKPPHQAVRSAMPNWCGRMRDVEAAPEPFNAPRWPLSNAVIDGAPIVAWTLFRTAAHVLASRLRRRHAPAANEPRPFSFLQDLGNRPRRAYRRKLVLRGRMDAAPPLIRRFFRQGLGRLGGCA